MKRIGNILLKFLVAFGCIFFVNASMNASMNGKVVSDVYAAQTGKANVWFEEKEVTLSITGTKTKSVYEKKQLVLKTKNGITIENVTYEVKNKKIVKVSKKGKLKAKRQGSTKVVATVTFTKNGKTKVKQKKVQVQVEDNRKKLIVIDAGHQRYANTSQEPVGPGASATKAKVTGGTTGRFTGLPEYRLNLKVAKKLKKELVKRGYQVIMVRTKHDVNISNSERAAVANNAKADAFIRIHANGSTDASVNGAMTICQTPNNPYNASIYKECRKLSEYVLDGMVNATGFNKQYVWETDTMSGINWCQVPVTIVEMGYMSNQSDDTRMAKLSYRKKFAEGIADGLDAYFAN